MVARRWSLILWFIALSLAVRAGATPLEERAVSPAVANFLKVYLVQWLVYMTTQRTVVIEDGSFANWYEYPFQPRFDKDSLDYNILRHSAVGSAYYLFYRSRSYSRVEAFQWSALSSVAFEFTIETVTERPSFQDLYQTPVYGTIVGIGLEALGRWYYRRSGRVPPEWLDKSAAHPWIFNGGAGAMLSLRF